MMDIWSDEEMERIVASRSTIAGASLRRLATECADLAVLLSETTSDTSSSSSSSSPPPKVPTVRYGRTGIDMPIVSLGCMRFQQTWNSSSVHSSEQVDGGCQDNLLRILRHAVKCGIYHIETARGYGCSELQLGMALRTLFDEGTCEREKLIIQTKGGISSSTTKDEYKLQILEQIERLGLEYVDLFSVHGANTPDHHHWLFHRSEEDGGRLIEAVRELRDEGKVRWIGFSTHAPAHVIRGLIETDAFDYVNRESSHPPQSFVTKFKGVSSLTPARRSPNSHALPPQCITTSWDRIPPAATATPTSRGTSTTSDSRTSTTWGCS